MLRDLLKSPREAKRLSVRAISGHRINSICNHDYPCADRDSLTGKTIWIAGTIIVLMMITNVRLHASSEFRNRPGEVSTPNRMSLH
jgi:hypothetical protein